ncbi:MAG: hypothetical protein WC804_13605 [Sphingomonas sp.]|jgi:hypothetical protein|uniref:hypothetical protein n=1 Tax=Sphingomonas sp. TaxID=28214 RepID=UPI003564B9A2
MRKFLALPLVLLATPVIAQDRHPAPSADQRVAAVGDALSDPAVQESAAIFVGALADALLDTHVGPIARYTDPRDGVRPNDTLRDVITRDDPAFERHLHDGTRGAVAATGQAARDAAAMTAEINATAARLRRALGAASAALDDSHRDN